MKFVFICAVRTPVQVGLVIDSILAWSKTEWYFLQPVDGFPGKKVTKAYIKKVTSKGKTKQGLVTGTPPPSEGCKWLLYDVILFVHPNNKILDLYLSVYFSSMHLNDTCFVNIIQIIVTFEVPFQAYFLEVSCECLVPQKKYRIPKTNSESRKNSPLELKWFEGLKLFTFWYFLT